MLDTGTILGIVKWVALILVPASALWGLLGAKATREEPDGRKRLTRGGIVTVALMIGAFLLSAASFQLDRSITAAAEAQAAEKAARARLASAETRLKDVRRRLDAARLDRLRDAERRAFAAEDRAGRAEARTQAVVLASEARLRDLALAQNVAVGTRDNLARTGVALTQIERVLVPLETLDVTITWKLPGDTPGLKESTAFIAKDARAAEADEYKKWLESPTNRGRQFHPFTYYDVRLRNPDVPGNRSRAERNLSEQIGTAIVIMDFFAATRPVDDAIRSLKEGVITTAPPGDLRISLRLPKPQTYKYERSTGSLLLTFTKEVTPDLMQRNDAIVSALDFEKAFGAISLPGRLMARARPIVVSFKGHTRSYEFEPEAMRDIGTGRSGAVFALPPLVPTRPGTFRVRG